MPKASDSSGGWAPGRFMLAGWAVLGALLLGAGSVPWLLSEPTRLAGFVNRMLPELDADITIGRASIGWTGPIVIEDVHVLPRNGAAEPLSIARIEGSHGLAKILLSLGDLGLFRVQGVDLHLIFRENRTSNVTGLFLPKPPAADGAETGRQGRRLSPVRVRIEIEDAVARVDGPWSADQWVSDPIDVRAALAPSVEGNWSEWRIDPVQLLSASLLKPSVAEGVLVYIAPVLAGATRTAGLFSLRIDGATFPVGDPSGGRLSGMLSMHAVDLGPGPLAQNVINNIPIGLRPPESIRVADDCNVTFVLENRQVRHDGLKFGIPLAQPGRRLDIHSSGTVALDDGALDLQLKLPLPLDMPAGRPVLQALAGKTISVGIAGVLGNPRVVFDGSIRAVAGQMIDELFGGRGGIGGPRPMPTPRRRPLPGPAPNQLPANADDAAPPTANAPAADDSTVSTGEQVIDLVGGVLDGLARRRAERAALQEEAAAGTDAAAPSAEPIRRPIRDRIRARREGR